MGIPKSPFAVRVLVNPLSPNPVGPVVSVGFAPSIAWDTPIPATARREGRMRLVVDSQEWLALSVADLWPLETWAGRRVDAATAPHVRAVAALDAWWSLFGVAESAPP
jgi:hypothetical protein